MRASSDGHLPNLGLEGFSREFHHSVVGVVQTQAKAANVDSVKQSRSLRLHVCFARA